MKFILEKIDDNSWSLKLPQGLGCHSLSLKEVFKIIEEYSPPQHQKLPKRIKDNNTENKLSNWSDLILNDKTIAENSVDCANIESDNNRLGR